MRMDMRASTRIEELIEYLSGELEGRMGLRSWLGPMLDGTSTAAESTGPSDLALVSARATARVERAFVLLPTGHLEVLIAAYSPRGPQTPMGCGPNGPDGLRGAFESKAKMCDSRALASIAALLEGRERGETSDQGADRLRHLVRQRAQAKGEEKRVIALQLGYAKNRAKRALDLAQEAYLEAYETARSAERGDRLKRRARHVEVRC